MNKSDTAERDSLKSCQANAQSIAPTDSEAHIREQKEVPSIALLIHKCLRVRNERTVEQPLRRSHRASAEG